MSREKLINAFNLLAEAAALVAIELEASDTSAAGPPPPAPSSGAGGPARPSAPANADIIDQGECPAHHREWKMGNYGPFCTAKADDPAWSNKNGYCTITPKNAPQWLRVNGVAA